MERKKDGHFILPLIFYDFVILIITILVLYVFSGSRPLGFTGILQQSILAAVLIFAARIIGKVYKQVWRYGGIQCYIRLLVCDGISFLAYLVLERVLPFEHVAFSKLLAFCAVNCLGSLCIRMVYRYAYKCGGQDNIIGRFLRGLLRVFAGGRQHAEADPNSQKIKVAIVGAGTTGVNLAEELLTNPKSLYLPRLFIDIGEEKIGRTVHSLRIMPPDEHTLEIMKQLHIQEVIFTTPDDEPSAMLSRYDFYKKAGLGVKVYGYPTMDIPGQKRNIRDFDVSDLLFRSERDIIDETTASYYRDKVVLITGGGGSIGSELCRQLARMKPRQLIVLDMYENTCYTLQQDLLFAYQGALDIQVEIVSIANPIGLARVFEKYHPDICINAAAHKHVPLMENNCIEAVENNVFGALNVIRCCEKYGCGRFMMVSTDKAVNPTNVMGATKRMCEMIMQAYSTRGIVHCSATRFGNVLGSAGSVIPIFKRQIAAGGPVTLTDKRIIRYFMTIPEASQLVLTSGAIAQNGELFVLDMGKPVKILDLATNMIAMSGVPNIEIVEIGLRPGEKLYEELLVSRDNLEKTENDLIFREHESPVTMPELEEKLEILRAACKANDDDGVREALRKVVPTFHKPEEVNKDVH